MGAFQPRAHAGGTWRPSGGRSTSRTGFLLALRQFCFGQKRCSGANHIQYGLHKDYHQPSDDIAHIDFQHMNDAIGSLLEPIEWLVNSDFKPEWKEGGRP